MTFRATKIALLAAAFAVATCIVGFASAPCGVPNQILCQGEDGTGTFFASQNDTNDGGFGNFATIYDHFTLTKTWDVESFHWVGGYFNGGQAPITAWTLTFYRDNAGTPGSALASGVFAGNGKETVLGDGAYMYSLDFGSFDMGPGTYWASVVPDLGFPPQWGWATSATGDNGGYQCFFGSCAGTATNFAFALDGKPIPEPGTMFMLGTGILGLAGAFRHKLQ